MWRPAAIGSLAALLLAFAGPSGRAQDRTPQAPTPGQAASDFLTAEVAQSILGPGAEARGVSPTLCWYAEPGYTGRAPKDKLVRLTVWHFAAPLADDFALKKAFIAEFPKTNEVVTELDDFADAAIWIWVPHRGGTLYAFQAGTLQVEVTLSGLAEDVALQRAKALAARPLGGSAGTGFAYLGTPEGDAAQAAALVAAATAAEALAAAPAAPPAPARPPASLADVTYVTQSELFHELTEVSLYVDLDPALEEWISLDEQRAAVVAALAANGITVVPMAQARADVKVLYYRTAVEWYDELYHTHEFLLSLDFVVRAAVLRGGSFHVMNAAVAGDRVHHTLFEASETRKLVFGDELTSEMQAELPLLLESVLASIAANTNVDDAPWYASGWSDAELAAANAAFVTAMLAPTPEGGRFAGIDSAPLYALHAPSVDEYCQPLDAWREQWTRSFEDLGWVNERSAASCPLTLLHVFGCEYMDVINIPPYYRMMTAMQLKESNAVFELNGRLVRKPAVLGAWAQVGAALDQDLDDALSSIGYLIDDACYDIETGVK